MSERVYTDDEILAMLGVEKEEKPLWRRALDKRTARSSIRIRCSVCGELGHNRRTCGDISVRVRHTQRCSSCGELGHNRRSCPQAQTSAGGST